MKKKYIVIIAILAVLTVAVGVSISRNNSNNNEKEHLEKDNEIVIHVPEEDDIESSEENEEEVQAEAPAVTFDESVAVAAWTTSNLNLREQPDGNSTVITVISQGTELKKGTEENGWAQVKVGDTIGYVSTQYISDTKPEEKPVEEQVTQTPNTLKDCGQ